MADPSKPLDVVQVKANYRPIKDQLRFVENRGERSVRQGVFVIFVKEEKL
jgi:hypothetical protein